MCFHVFTCCCEFRGSWSRSQVLNLLHSFMLMKPASIWPGGEECYWAKSNHADTREVQTLHGVQLFQRLVLLHMYQHLGHITQAKLLDKLHRVLLASEGREDVMVTALHMGQSSFSLHSSEGLVCDSSTYDNGIPPSMFSGPHRKSMITVHMRNVHF